MKDVAFKWKFTYSKNVCFSLWIWPASHPEEVRLHSRLFQVFVFLTLISGSVLVLHFAVNYFTFTLTHLPQKFWRKTCFEASQVVFWSLWCYKELKLTIKLFTGCKRHGFLIPDAKHKLAKFRHMLKEKFQDSILGLMWYSSLDFYFFAFSPPLFFHLSCLIFYFFCGAFSRLHF